MCHVVLLLTKKLPKSYDFNIITWHLASFQEPLNGGLAADLKPQVTDRQRIRRPRSFWAVECRELFKARRYFLNNCFAGRRFGLLKCLAKMIHSLLVAMPLHNLY